MRRIIKYYRLPLTLKLLLLKSFLLLVEYKIRLKILPFEKFRRHYAESIIRKRIFCRTMTSPVQADDIVWSVETASNILPFKCTCLIKAFCGKFLLFKYYHSSRLLIGVKKIQGNIIAHAWISYNDKVVIGNHPDGEYITIGELN